MQLHHHFFGYFGLLFVFRWVRDACFFEGFFAVVAGFTFATVFNAVAVTRPCQIEWHA
jgi:hypothetical protein